jgi:predicted ferric reductase
VVADVTSAARRPRLASLAGMLLAGLGLGVSGVLVGAALNRVRGNQMAPWILGRASGVCAYLLLVALVLVGLVLSSPARARNGGSSPARIRLHLSLALFTLAFTVVHVVVLATDQWAGVGWAGAVVPLGAAYRPLPVTLGLIGAWTGLLVGLTAALAGRLPHRLWWPLHKIAAVALVVIWLHGVLAGGDTPALLGLYVATGALVVGTALWRYNARRAAAALTR